MFTGAAPTTSHREGGKYAPALLLACPRMTNRRHQSHLRFLLPGLCCWISLTWLGENWNARTMLRLTAMHPSGVEDVPSINTNHLIECWVVSDFDLIYASYKLCGPEGSRPPSIARSIREVRSARSIKPFTLCGAISATTCCCRCTGGPGRANRRLLWLIWLWLRDASVACISHKTYLACKVLPPTIHPFIRNWLP